MNAGERSSKEDDPEGDPDGIRVVRELRIGSSSAPPSPTFVPDGTQDRDFQARRGSGSGGETGTWNTAIEWDLGDYEFPDYKERMNAPI